MAKRNEPKPHVPTDATRARMRRVRRRDTRPEMEVRRILFAMGYRYRLHMRDLPGTPDIVFPARRKAIFVHGCFWHRHAGCPKASTPRSDDEFWRTKFEANVRRDERKESELKGMGWRVLIIWECQIRNASAMAEQLLGFLGSPSDARGSRDNDE
jgi:DNA mismatch endonuclease (patch repair protein)